MTACGRVPTIPLLLEADGRGVDEWIEDFAWPSDPMDGFRVMARTIERVTDFMLALPEPERSTALLARAIMEAAAVIEAAMAVAGEERTGVRMAGPPVLDWLRNGVPENADPRGWVIRMDERHVAQRIEWQFLRRLARAKSWAGAFGALTALAFPQALAITHNPLLVDEARRTGIRLSFRHAVPYVKGLVSQAGGCGLRTLDHDRTQDLAARMSAVLAAEPLLEPYMADRVASVLRPIVVRQLEEADGILSALAKVRRLPKVLWTGNGSFPPSRALGMEILRRGGTVRRFDHGGTVSLIDDPSYLVQQEMAVSSEFVMPTRKAADLQVVQAAAQAARAVREVSVLHGKGDPYLVPAPHTAVRASGRRRVLFVGSAYYGFSQSYPAFPPAPVYLDWQRRVLRMLQAMPVDVIYKPHPGGLFNGCPPPLRQVADVDARLFEQAQADADVFVYDIAASTTFSVALCTEKPIVLLDFGCLRFSAEIWPLIDARCRVVKVASDERNRLTVDPKALENAVLGASDSPDSAYFRELFLGDYG